MYCNPKKVPWFNNPIRWRNLAPDSSGLGIADYFHLPALDCLCLRAAECLGLGVTDCFAFRSGWFSDLPSSLLSSLQGELLPFLWRKLSWLSLNADMILTGCKTLVSLSDWWEVLRLCYCSGRNDKLCLFVTCWNITMIRRRRKDFACGDFAGVLMIHRTLWLM